VTSWSAASLASLPATKRQTFLESLSDAEAEYLLHDWDFWARPAQREPAGDWRYWLINAGRGFGKTRTGAEMVRAWAKRYRYVNLIGATSDDARDIMIEGESGILAICPRDERPEYRRHLSRLDWPSGCRSLIFTADKPARLRGKQHEKLWADELAAWRYAEDAWDQAMLGMRLGDSPQAIITTTPRPIKVLRDLIKDPHCVVTTGSTYENRANLADAFFDAIITKYEGTRLGRQELEAELLEDTPGALWHLAQLDALRVKAAPALKRIVVGVDPSATTTGDEAGIIVAGLGIDGHGYVLEDASLQASPHGWGSRAVTMYHAHQADRIVAETNNGGEMVELTIRTVDDKVSYKAVHASRGKRTRAEPIAALYEQGKVHHVGTLAKLEDEQCHWTPDDEESPNRMDAMVWALTELMLVGQRSYAPL